MPDNLPSRPLKSTALHYAYPSPTPTPASLPLGWTEHKAPTGHSYFYHAATKTSSYTRPVAPSPYPPVQPANTSVPYHQYHPHPAHVSSAQPSHVGAVFSRQIPATTSFPYHPQVPYHHGRGGRFNQSRLQAKPDRPGRKLTIPNMTPWALVTTKLGREFVHNLETRVSLWMGKAPEEVVKAVEKLKGMSEEELKKLGEQDKREREERVKARAREKVKREKMVEEGNDGGGNSEEENEEEDEEEGGESEYEDEGSKEDGAEGDGAQGARGLKRSISATALEPGDPEAEEAYDRASSLTKKRLKPAPGSPKGAVEFTEEDISWQLESLAADYSLTEEDLLSQELPPEHAIQVFMELLDEVQPNPYSTWELTYPSLVDDPRYTVLSTSKSRQGVFTSWCRSRISALKAEKEKAEKRDPRVEFLEFLRQRAKDVKKLYWAEFKRKYKKEQEMRDVRVQDKEREKMYREFSAHIKLNLSPKLLENDLQKLLKATPGLNRTTTLDKLPLSILTDVRYSAYPLPALFDGDASPAQPLSREEVMHSYLSSLPVEGIFSGKQLSEKELKERQRLDALRERERTVRREQGRLRGEIEKGRELLRGEEREVERAVKEVSRKGLVESLEAEIERGREREEEREQEREEERKRERKVLEK